MWRTGIGYIVLLIVVLTMFLVAAIFQTSTAEPKENPTYMKNVSSPILSESQKTSFLKSMEKKSKKKAKKKKSSSKTSSSRSQEGSSEKKSSEDTTSGTSDHTAMYGAGYFMQMGEVYENGWRYTWYSEEVLPGGGLDIPGRHVDDEGYVVDYEGRLVAASEDIPYGTEISVPFGSGTAVVRDCGCPSGTIDIYVSW